MMGREFGGEERRAETVDLPVAIEPVRPIMSIVRISLVVCLRIGKRIDR